MTHFTVGPTRCGITTDPDFATESLAAMTQRVKPQTALRLQSRGVTLGQNSTPIRTSLFPGCGGHALGIWF
ncbi:hypothetical protein C7M71_030080 [Peterkaempfera bronchialis]|uniref:Uncharacterized protein n=1 Tax=Peterkaempfera bronchialis TaxID=2126346 RepID=A0A345T4U4_9ACTN|nr:hypothetical protein C7M71_030080 [Peterkaempfera bronchialis]